MKVKLKILVMIQMVAIILVVFFTLTGSLPPAIKAIIILYVSLETLSTILYYIAYIKLKNALESISEGILREHTKN